MWQSLLTRRFQQQNRARKAPRSGIAHMMRVPAEIKLRDTTRENSLLTQPPTVIEARLLLCDFTATWMGVFSSVALQPGQEVAITLEYPKRFFCIGKVLSCAANPHAARIVKEVPFEYRVCISIQFRSEDEFRSVYGYVRELHVEHSLAA